MIRSILVPLDGSPFSEHALPVAAAIVSRHAAALHLVRVHEPVDPVMVSPVAAAMAPAVPSPSALDTTWEAELRREAESYLQSIAERVRDGWDLIPTIELLEGRPVDALSAQVSDRSVDLVVMTTHGRSGLDRLWLGSVAEGVVRHTSAPVLLVKPGEALGASPTRFRQVLVSLDGSELAESVIQPAIDVAGPQAAFTLLRVTEPLTALVAATLPAATDAYRVARERLDQQIDGYLGSMADRLRALGLEMRRQSTEHAHVARAILQSASEIGADLIALATHGRKGFRRLLLGSTADKVVRAAESCVLVCRPPGE